jgi:hypothetical protein
MIVANTKNLLTIAVMKRENTKAVIMNASKIQLRKPKKRKLLLKTKAKLDQKLVQKVKKVQKLVQKVKNTEFADTSSILNLTINKINF